MVLFPRSLRHSVLSVAKPLLYRFREAPHAGLSKFTSSLSQQDSLPTFRMALPFCFLRLVGRTPNIYYSIGSNATTDICSTLVSAKWVRNPNFSQITVLPYEYIYFAHPQGFSVFLQASVHSLWTCLPSSYLFHPAFLYPPSLLYRTFTALSFIYWTFTVLSSIYRTFTAP